MRPPILNKPLVYLDQNILDAFVKGKADWLFDIVASQGQIVYSDITLTEIKGSLGHVNNFLRVLEKLNAMYMQLHFPKDSHQIAVGITLTAGSPFSAYDELIDSLAQNPFSEPFNQFLFKLAGGRKDDSISDVLDEQRLAAYELQKSMQSLIPELEPADFEEAENLGISKESLMKFPALIKDALQSSIDGLEKTITNNHPETKSWNSIGELREALKIGPKVLNNIKPPKVVEQIWEIIKDYIPTANDFDEAFGLNNNSDTINTKALKLYNLLNSLGYWPDSKITKERRFKAALNDNNHAMWASFCSVLISADENFVKKAKAVYEYLNIKTEVVYVPH